MKKRNRKDPKKWRAAVDGYRLHFDLERLAWLEMAKAQGKTDLQSALDMFEQGCKAVAPGGKDSKLTGPAPLPGEGIVDAYLRLLAGGLETNDRYAHTEWAATASAYLQIALVMSNRTKIFLANSEMAADVIGSRNDAISGEDLELLPFPQTWLEFDEPLEVARGFTRPFLVKAVGFWCVQTAPLRLVTLISAWRDEQDVRVTPSLNLLFWNRRLMSNVSTPDLAEHLGFDPKLPHPEYDRMAGECEVAAKNLYDMLTSRSFDYSDEQREPKDFSKFRRFKHLQGGAAQGVRQYKVIRLNKEVARRDEHAHGPLSVPIGTEAAVDIPGAFHRWTYCRACGDTHRHDLLGLPCRKCGINVGPTANLKIERWWHPPYRRGSGVLKEYVRHMV